MTTTSSSQRNDSAEGVQPIDVADFQRREVSVLVAGRSRAGKSTALNNIFGLNLRAGASPSSVTRHVTITRIIQNDVVLNVIDTPGLGAVDIPREEILSDIKKLKITKEFILVYCISVAPNSCVQDTDRTIFKNIQSIFGKWVWNRCILVLTSSDNARMEFPTDRHDVEYIAYLRGHVDNFYSALTSCGSIEIPGAMLLFDYHKNDYATTVYNKLVAVPAAKHKFCNSINIIPGIWFEEEYDWTDYAFMEILKKADKLDRDVLLCFKYNIISTLKMAAKGGLVTTVVAGGIGAVAATETATGASVLATGAVMGGAAGVAVGGAVLAIGIEISMAWLAIHILKQRFR